jgi:hypothetical protein
MRMGTNPSERTGKTHDHRTPSVSERHRVAVVQAEARRLARILQPFGVLRKDQLKLRAGASSWHEGGFDSALHAAIEAGEIERLPLDFYRTTDDSVRGRSAPGAA